MRRWANGMESPRRICAKDRIERAEAVDLESVLALLMAVNLPLEGVRESSEHFWIWRERNSAPIKGCIGLEIYGSDAVLRSFAVHPEFRSLGIGGRLLRTALKHARQSGVKRVFLLTSTAADYFSLKGFLPTDRETVPSTIAQSIEFRSICPKSATCMALSLGR
jgi:amino-acid N-acetyltransferase